MTETNMTEDSERLLLCESDVINLILEFLSKRGLATSQLELERESGVLNEIIASPDLVFLRSLVVDGRWDDVVEFLQPLEEAFRSFPGKRVRATILKHRFLDMLSGHAESCSVNLASGREQEKSGVVEELVKVLNELEGYCDSKEEYSSLCLLLTSPNRMSEHPEYKDWKSATARLACFEHLKPLVQRFIPPPSGQPKTLKVSTSDRLIQLLIKGLMYEACVDYCQSKAIKSDGKSDALKPTDCHLRFSTLLKDTTLSESDLSLLSWLRSIPNQTFSCPFQRRSLRVDVEPLPKPQKTLMNISIMDSASDLLSRSMASTSFHLSSTEAQPDLKSMTTSVDRLFGDAIPTDSFNQKALTTEIKYNQAGRYSATSTDKGSLYSAQTGSRQSVQSKPASVSSRTRSSNSLDSNSTVEGDFDSGMMKAKFLPVTSLEDVQAVRCAEFHPSGKVYAIGSNSKTLRVCAYPDLTDLTENHLAYQPTILFKRTKHHKGSIYCMGWSPDGKILATGSNDKTVRLIRFDDISGSELTGSQEVELSMHDGTVRDLCFVQEANKSSLLVSGGAGDCKIYVTDCATTTPFQALSGHTGAILSLCNWGGGMFCSGSQDKTIRFWDLRTRGCVDTVTPLTSATQTKSAVASVCVEPSGRLLISGHEDAATVLYDVRGQRQIQALKTHAADVRSVRFSPAAYYLLSGGYDNRLVLSDLQNDLSMPLPSVVVATHQDKVISGRWHPSEFTFLSTSADKTCVLWALPPEP